MKKYVETIGRRTDPPRLFGNGLLILCLSIWLQPLTALGAGTPAGTEIRSTATATYQVGSQTTVTRSNTATFKVAEILNVTATWQDAEEVAVQPGSTGQVLTFRITNTGNGRDSYTLTAESPNGTDFEPTPTGFYLDDGDGEFNPAMDALYVPESNDPTLGAGEHLTLFAAYDIPGGLTDRQLGRCGIIATSRTATGSGTALPGGGDNGSDAVVGPSGGIATAGGAFAASVLEVSAVKSVEVRDPFGGENPTPKSTLVYTIEVTVSGSGSASDVVFTDPIPENTNLVEGSLTLNGDPLTDEADEDAGDVGQSAPGTIRVALGDLTESSPKQIIAFQVQID